MNTKPLFFHIVLNGQISPNWTRWFDGLTVSEAPSGLLNLEGTLADQSALMGVLYQAANLGLEIVRLECVQQPTSMAKGEPSHVPDQTQFPEKTI